jgi:hypothetical protein
VPGGKRNSYGRSASGLRPGGLFHGEDAKSKAAPLEGGEIVLHDRGACAAVSLALRSLRCRVSRYVTALAHGVRGVGDRTRRGVP